MHQISKTHSTQTFILWPTNDWTQKQTNRQAEAHGWKGWTDSFFAICFMNQSSNLLLYVAWMYQATICKYYSVDQNEEKAWMA